ncbi:MAG: TIGR02677 family protein, partial [Bacillota bacterium]
YQAERVALRLEELRVRLEEELAAATINPAALENLLRRLEELVAWAAGHLGPGAGDPPDAPDSPAPPEAARAFDLWNAVYSAFDAFARGVEDYVSDLPRHRPKETLGYEEFLAYRDAITRYLSGYIRHLFDRREQIRVLLERLRPYAEALVAQVAAVAAAQVRADGSRPDREQEAARCRAEWEALCGYFREGGDVDILLDQAQGWIADITRHARRLSEQHLGSTVRAELLLDLARRFARAESLAACERLAQVAFGATLPLHWKGSAPPPPPAGAWESPPVEVPLTPVRRGGRRRVQGDATEDRSPEQIARMQAEAQAREAAARELAALFGPDGRLDLGALRLASPRQRQQILHLLYRALAQGGVASVGYRNWTVAVSLPPEPELGRVEAPDGVLILPRFRLELRRGRDRRG